MGYRFTRMEPAEYSNTPVESGGVFQYQQIDGVLYVEIEADTFADIPSAPGSIQTDTVHGSLNFAIGSRAHTIDDNKNYKLKSDGTWVEQIDADLSSLITMVSDVQSTVGTLTGEVDTVTSQVEDYILPALKQLINEGAKNRIPLLPSMTTVDHDVTFTVNSDGTIDISGTANGGTAFFSAPITLPVGVYVFNGMPEAGGTASYRQEIRATPGGAVYQVNDTEAPVVFERTTAYSGYYSIRVASGYSISTTLKPMICFEKYYAVTQDFVPYAPTLRELYSAIS